MGVWQTIWSLDPIGTLTFVPSIVCLLIALQWGGTTYAWSDGRIIALLTVFCILLVGFVISQLWLGEIATGKSLQLLVSEAFADLVISSSPNRVAANNRICFAFLDFAWCKLLPLHIFHPDLVPSNHGHRCIHVGYS